MTLREPATVDLDCLFCARETAHRVLRMPAERPRWRRSAEPERLLAVCVFCGGGMPVPAPVVPEPRPVEPLERLRASECLWPTFWS